MLYLVYNFDNFTYKTNYDPCMLIVTDVTVGLGASYGGPIWLGPYGNCLYVCLVVSQLLLPVARGN